MITSIFLYLCMLAYMGLFAVLYDKYITLVLFFMLLVLPVVLFLHLVYLQTCIKVRFHERMGVIGKNEEIQIVIEVENKSIFPVSDVAVRFCYQNMFSDAKKHESISFSVPGRRHKKNAVKHMTLVLATPYCGNIHVTCERVKIFDYLHLTAFTKKPRKKSKTISKSSVSVSVLPAFEEVDLSDTDMAMEEDIFSMENDHFSKTKPGDDPSEIFDIREYREGDRIHRIHWKLSSKRNQWMVKDFSLPMSCQTAVLLDLYQSEKEEDVCAFMDNILSEALSVSFSLMQQGILHDFVWVDGKDARLYEYHIQKEEDLYEMLEQLLYSRPYSSENKNLFQDTYNSLYQNKEISKYFYISQSQSEAVRGLI